MYCSNCGMQMLKTSKFCSWCGKVVSDVQALSTPIYQTQPIMKPVQKVTSEYNTVICPNCNSSYVEYMTTDVIGRKVNQKTSVNLNSLEPFTVFNHNERVVSEWKQINKWLCMNCGNIFTQAKGQTQENRISMAVEIGMLLAFAFSLLMIVLSIIV